MECPGSYQLAVRYREFKEHDDVYNKQLSEFGVVKSVERRTDVNRVRDVLVVRVRDSSILKDGEYTWFAEYCELLSEIPCPPSPK